MQKIKLRGFKTKWAMSATNFNTRNDTWRKLLGNGLTYSIPQFQRDYSWAEDEWEDLWLDIQEVIQPNGQQAHYMGYLVLQSDNDKSFDVIDGQQRLTTLSVFVLAILKNLQRLVQEGNDPENNSQRASQIRQSYIGYLDPITLIPRSKLSLNRNNDHYYQTYLVPLAALPQRGFRASEHLLRKAFEWFNRKIREYADEHSTDKGIALAQLVETMSDRLFFTVITVTDELNAYKVFETLNSRGVRLSPTDLLKNYLFSIIHRVNEHQQELKALDDRWNAIVGRLGSGSFPDFVRTHWNSRQKFVRHTDLFKAIRGAVTTREQAFGLLRAMEEDLDTYLFLSSPESSDWSPELKKYAAYLRLFNVKQPFSLLLAVRRHWESQGFASILRACVMISFRYNVIGNRPTNEQERSYNLAAAAVSQGIRNTPQEIWPLLSEVYPSDDQFKAMFSDKIIRTTQTRNRRIVRYILCSIEHHNSRAELDFDSNNFNIEHILPEKPTDGWEAFTEEELETQLYRLGNMILIATSDNNRASNLPYQSKREIYKESSFNITKKVADENDVWNAERIENHQRWMAKQATAIWRVDY